MALASAIWSVPIASALAFGPIFVRGFLVTRYGKSDNTKPRDKDAQTIGMSKDLKGVAERLLACHNNQLETLGLYAAGVAVAVAVRTPPETLVKLTGYYIKSRVAYICAYTAPQVGNGALRSLTFFGSMTSIMMIYAAAAKAATDV